MRYIPHQIPRTLIVRVMKESSRKDLILIPSFSAQQQTQFALRSGSPQTILSPYHIGGSHITMYTTMYTTMYHYVLLYYVLLLVHRQTNCERFNENKL